ncbi:nuclear receptor coactivator 7-like [Artemia franciscana]|uniref:Oxidation resistance protein 1 n=1 Tax=Artemia franciscana TaxID=6661 RepID=A0AA88HT47_ARTSF|nr:hypothetical protein QYM36_009209 [Artemia franciscana]
MSKNPELELQRGNLSPTSPMGPSLIHKVTSRDTLTGLAARYNITPSELCSFNKLTTRYIFPGQTLMIPVEENKEGAVPTQSVRFQLGENLEDESESNKPEMDIIKEEAVNAGVEKVVKEEDEELTSVVEEELTQRFLKVDVKHITEGQGVINGVLLITPNVIMFDPDVSDPLVVENGGPDSFGVVLPMEFILCATIYKDFGTSQSESSADESTGDSFERNRCPRVFFPANYEILKRFIEKRKSEELFINENHFGGSSPNSNRSSFDNKENIKGSNENTNLTDRFRRSKSVRNERSDGTPRRRSLMKGISIDLRSKSECLDSVNIASLIRDTGSYGKTQGQQVLKRLSQPFAWMEESLSIPSLPTTSLKSLRSPSKGESSILSVLPKMSFGSSSVESFGESETESELPRHCERTKLKSLKESEAFSEKFTSMDELMSKIECHQKSLPMYLHLQMGQPVDQNSRTDFEKLRKSPITSYGKKLIKPEYWFAVSSDKVESVCRFFLLWAPGLYGDPSDVDPSDRPELDPLIDELFISDEENKPGLKHTVSGIDFDSYVRDLVGDSDILDFEMCKALARKLPPRTEGCCWVRSFTTSEDGFSLSNLYRKLADITSPTLLVVEDTKAHIFGALVSCGIRISESFYGSGESFLFKFTPKLKVFSWSGENQYFVKGNIESIAIGAGDGRFGLWLDGDLYKGRSQACSTFGNEPLSEDEDFVVKQVECWTFPGS